MNKIFIKGRITNAPELKKTANDISVCSFSVAVKRRFGNDTTDFINCEAWRNTAEFICKYFTKGKEILIEGELHIEKYQKDDETRTVSKVVVDNVEFCGSKKDGEEKNGDKSNEQSNSGVVLNDEDPLPF